MKFVHAIPLLLMLLACPTVFAEKQQAPAQVEGAQTLSAEAVVGLILDNPQLIVIDARRHEEYLKGHIEGAVNVLDEEITPEVLQQTIPQKSTPVLFYCNGVFCLRSSNAATKALKLGYHQVYWFRGGWVEWMEKRLPVAKGPAN